jgi:hypothetical protein
MPLSARLRVVLTTFVTIVAGTVIVAPAARADTTILTCPMAASVTLSPGISLVNPLPQIVGGSATFGTGLLAATPCTSPTGQPFVGGTGEISGTARLTCLPSPLSLLGTASGTIAVTWANAANHVAGHSTISWSLTVSGPLLVFTANISSGDMSGSTVQMPLAVTGFTGLCDLLGAPVTGVSFAGLAIVLQP